MIEYSIFIERDILEKTLNRLPIFFNKYVKLKIYFKIP